MLNFERFQHPLKEVCLDIEKRYQTKFLEIGTDKGHVRFFNAICSRVYRDENNNHSKKSECS